MADVNTAVEDAKAVGPPSSMGFGPREDADTTRQAQQKVANDAIADIDFNSVVAREQASTFVLMGKNFESNADRRGKIADFFMGKLFEKP